jgi:hypothetical protein
MSIDKMYVHFHISFHVHVHVVHVNVHVLAHVHFHVDFDVHFHVDEHEQVHVHVFCSLHAHGLDRNKEDYPSLLVQQGRDQNSQIGGIQRKHIVKEGNRRVLQQIMMSPNSRFELT